MGMIEISFSTMRVHGVYWMRVRSQHRAAADGSRTKDARPSRDDLGLHELRTNARPAKMIR
jgi:hypothetical protein